MLKCKFGLNAIPAQRSMLMRRLAFAVAIGSTVAAFPGARAVADVITTGDGGMTVIDTVTTPTYGTTTMTWPADANFAASVYNNKNTSPYYVSGINPNGSMSLGTAFNFIAALNNPADPYLGITTWSLPTTVAQDLTSTCSFDNAGGNFGYNCGKASPSNKVYPYSELAGLFYNVLGGQAHNSIVSVHNSNLSLFNNLQPYLYWSSTAQFNYLHFSNDFWFQNGFQGTEDVYDSMFVLPVSTTTTGTAPTTTPALPGPLLGLGLNTTLPTATPTLQRSADGTLIYDPTLNVTFLANANLARTLLTQSPASPYLVNGINPDGSMSATTLANFLTALNNPVNLYLGINGWTVPLIAEDGQNPNCTLSDVGQNKAGGYNCDGQASQLGELFYDQLGGIAGNDIALTSNVDASFFDNLNSSYYWQCQPTVQNLPGMCDVATDRGGPSFSFLSGYQGSQADPNDLYALLEVPGNAIAAPEPSTITLFGVGLFGLFAFGMMRRHPSL